MGLGWFGHRRFYRSINSGGMVKKKNQLSAKTLHCRSRYAKASHFAERQTSIVAVKMSANMISDIIQSYFTAEIEKLKLSHGSPSMPTTVVGLVVSLLVSLSPNTWFRR